MTVRDKTTVLLLAVSMGAIRVFATEPESPLVPALVTVPAPFIPLPPCRIADTRDPTMPPGYGPPSLTPGPPARSFYMWGRCGIPVGATAVSLNVTVDNPQGLGYVLLYPTGGPQPGVSTLNFLAGRTVANAALVPIGLGGVTAATAVSPTDFIIDTNGYYAGSPMDPVSNVFLGYISGNPLLDGIKSTGIGFAALNEVAAGDGTAVGYRALRANGAAYRNVAIGAMALDALSEGYETVAFGRGALALNEGGSESTAVGAGALAMNLGGLHTAIGTGALNTLPGLYNVVAAMGYSAGSSATEGGFNVYIANPGSTSDSSTSTIRIGSVVQTRAFLAGIRNASISAGLQVWIDAAGQLGTPVSSARYKEDVADAAAVSGRVQELRPVRFRYRDQTDEDSHYGLIAEEVERVLPELVVCDPSGEALTVLYDEVSILVLSELQKQARRLADGREKLNARREILEREEAAIDARERELDELERRLTTIRTRIPPDTTAADESAAGGLR